MKNPFRFLKSKTEYQEAISALIPDEPEEAEPTAEPEALTSEEVQDSFNEWHRTRVQGGIERRERNDIYEEYSVYGADGEKLMCRRYHRYPEHEREFGMSYSRELTFNDFDRRLLSELDRGSITLSEYHDCIARAEQLLSLSAADTVSFTGFSERELAVLKGFCESLDILKDIEYLGSQGVFRCSGISVVGEQALCLWFRKPLPHDAADMDVPGVEKTAVEGYDIDDLWIMGVYNRLSAKCGKCTVTRLTSMWSLKKTSVLLICTESFPDIEGAVLIAVADPADMARFGFYSLDFSRK